ncbi:MAG: hypothetical protein A2277_06515 [Desulfobacterales bacterium RIFOXYA12_FULL_46_15]|nr:MAG: hypothetical protein A2097_04385 [Desulfobacula sp. GWF2_41_7]OGR27587.1 MAG: hypothetical protein A2277_06515 [Desulfobacterales bacterium RIFOXYA12_FULL_46_15]
MIKQPLLFKDYQEGLAKGELLGVFCDKCHNFSFHTSVYCNHCGSTGLSAKPYDTTGVIRTFTVIRVAAEGRNAPFIVALVLGNSGIHMMGNLEGIDPDSASMGLIGKKVKISGKKTLPDRFSPKVEQCLVFSLED